MFLVVVIVLGFVRYNPRKVREMGRAGHCRPGGGAMNTLKQFGTGLALAVLMVTGFLPVRAQGPQELVTQTSFDFTAGETSFTAGKIQVERRGPSTLKIKSADGKSTVSLPIITKLSPRTGGACLVFDKLEGKTILSEIWFSDQEGFLVTATREDHEHTIVK